MVPSEKNQSYVYRVSCDLSSEEQLEYAGSHSSPSGPESRSGRGLEVLPVRGGSLGQRSALNFRRYF